MRQLLPAKEWVHHPVVAEAVRAFVEDARSGRLLPSCHAWDTRLVHRRPDADGPSQGGVVMDHVRVHAASDVSGPLHVVWSVSSSDMSAAALRAAVGAGLGVCSDRRQRVGGGWSGVVCAWSAGPVLERRHSMRILACGVAWWCPRGAWCGMCRRVSACCQLETAATYDSWCGFCWDVVGGRPVQDARRACKRVCTL